MVGSLHVLWVQYFVVDLYYYKELVFVLFLNEIGYTGVEIIFHKIG